MQGYYVAGMYVSGDHLCHANVDVAGFWRNLKKGGRVWVNSFQRNVKGLSNQYNAGVAGLGAGMKGHHFGTNKTAGKVGYAIGSGVRNAGNAISNTASRTARGADQAGKRARSGFEAGRRGWGYETNSIAGRAGHVAGRAARAVSNIPDNMREAAGNARFGYQAGRKGQKWMMTNTSMKIGYAAGNAARHINDAASTAKQWGSEAISKARSFIDRLFSGLTAAKAAFNIGAQGKKTPGGNAAVKAGNVAGLAISALKSGASEAISAGKTFMQSVFEAVGQARNKLRKMNPIRTMAQKKKNQKIFSQGIETAVGGAGRGKYS